MIGTVLHAMKHILPLVIPLVFFLTFTSRPQSGLVVNDPTLIATNRAH